MAAALCVAPLLGARPSAQSTEAAIPGAELTPGTIARLVEIPQATAAQDRLRTALGHPDPRVRAAASRIVFVTASTGLLREVRAALQAENATDAFVEQSRVLAAFGEAADIDRIVDGLGRVAAADALLLAAAARGVDTLKLFPGIRAHGIPRGVLADFVRLATRGDVTVLDTTAATAVQDGDDVLLEAALRAARDAQVRIPPATLARAIETPFGSAPGAAALWHLLDRWERGKSELPPEVLRPLQAAIAAPAAAAPSPDAALAYELAGRASGRPPRTDPAWTAVLTASVTDLRRRLATDAVRELLTPAERQTLITTYALDPRFFEPGQATAASRRHPDASLQAPLVTAAGYPTGYVESVVEAVGCDAGRAARSPFGNGLANVTLRRNGRAARIGLIDTRLSRECTEAVRLLLMAYAAPANRVVGEGDMVAVLVPFVASYLACQSVPAAGSTPEHPGEHGGVQSLKKTLDVKPQYPASMQRQRISGSVVLEGVVATTGCIKSVQVVKSVHPELDLAALKAVTAWQFTPALRDDKPADVLMTLTVNFLLR
jgi:TonB family protein